MIAKIFVVNIPQIEDIFELFDDMVERCCEPKARCCESKPQCCENNLHRCEPKPIRCEPKTSFCKRERLPHSCEPLPRWEVSEDDGVAEDCNKRFGAGFEIDEPRAEDYDERWMFEDDHKAYDRFVDAGEDCVARGLEKKSDAPINIVNAVRKRIEEGPVFNLPLVGETHWF